MVVIVVCLVVSVGSAVLSPLSSLKRSAENPHEPCAVSALPPDLRRWIDAAEPYGFGPAQADRWGDGSRSGFTATLTDPTRQFDLRIKVFVPSGRLTASAVSVFDRGRLATSSIVCAGALPTEAVVTALDADPFDIARLHADLLGRLAELGAVPLELSPDFATHRHQVEFEDELASIQRGGIVMKLRFIRATRLSTARRPEHAAPVTDERTLRRIAATVLAN